MSRAGVRNVGAGPLARFPEILQEDSFRGKIKGENQSVFIINVLMVVDDGGPKLGSPAAAVQLAPSTDPARDIKS